MLVGGLSRVVPTNPLPFLSLALFRFCSVRCLHDCPVDLFMFRISDRDIFQSLILSDNNQTHRTHEHDDEGWMFGVFVNDRRRGVGEVRRSKIKTSKLRRNSRLMYCTGIKFQWLVIEREGDFDGYSCNWASPLKRSRSLTPNPISITPLNSSRELNVKSINCIVLGNSTTLSTA